MTDESESRIRKIFPEVDQISDLALKSVVLRSWSRALTECGFERPEEIPFSVAVTGVGLVEHIQWVLKAALAMACLLEDKIEAQVNRDLLIAAVLLHDLAKVYEYRRTEAGWGKSKIGEEFMHGFWGAHVSLLEGAPLELAHLISTHCHGSPVPPRLLEGIILHYADFAHADIIRFQNKLPLFLAEKG